MRHDDDCLQSATDIATLKLKQEYMEKQQDKYEEMLEKVTRTQTMMAERMLQVEHMQEADSKLLHEMLKNDKLQNKLLTAIFTALTGIFVAVASKYFTNGGALH